MDILRQKIEYAWILDLKALKSMAAPRAALLALLSPCFNVIPHDATASYFH
jgi:hypothetical protein